MPQQSRDLAALLQATTDQGGSWERTKTGRIKVRNAEGRLVCTLPGNPGEWRAMRNAIGYLRRAGFTV